MTRLTDEQIAAIRDGCEGVTPGPWQALRSDPAEGVNCHWIEAQPSPALRGFSKEVAYVGGTYYADGPDVRDATHIARCDPDTIRALATEALESRAEIDRLRAALALGVVDIKRVTERSEQSEAEVLARIDRWLKVLGPIMGPGRANPNNDLQYLLIDAAECIRGLRQYARHLEIKP